MSEQPTPTNGQTDLSHRTPVRQKRPGDEIIKAHEAVKSFTSTNKRFPEHLFSDGFLQFFAGYDTHADFNIAAWVSIAGTPHSEVDIINQNGEVVFTVPAIFERDVLTPDNRGPSNQSITAIAKTFELLNAQSPARAEAHLNHQLGLTNQTAKMDQYRGKGKTRMAEIFKYYNLTPSWDLDKVAPVTSSTSEPQARSGPVDEESL